MIRNDRTGCPAPTDKPEKRVVQFQWSMAEFKEDLRNWSDNYTVNVTMTRQEPTVWVKFVTGEDDGYE
jgi:hypothetical protein